MFSRTGLRVLGLLTLIIVIASACRVAPANAAATSRTQAVSSYLEMLRPVLDAAPQGGVVSSPRNLDPLECAAGTVDDQLERQSVKAVNYFREMTGLARVSRSAPMSRVAQAAATTRVRKAIDDVPGSSHKPFANGNPCAHNPTTARAEVGSQRSNISWGATREEGGHGVSNGPRGIVGQFRDAGANNAVVGHRRAITSPLISKVGSGSALWTDASGTQHSANALYWMQPSWFVDSTDATSAIDPTGIAERPTNIEYVAWPPAGYVPDAVVYSRWSFAPNAEADRVEFRNVDVQVWVNGAELPLRSVTVSDTTAYSIPDDAVIWEPDLSSLPTLSSTAADDRNVDLTGADVTLRVSVSGVFIDGVEHNYRYAVTIMDADRF